MLCSYGQTAQVMPQPSYLLTSKFLNPPGLFSSSISLKICMFKKITPYEGRGFEHYHRVVWEYYIEWSLRSAYIAQCLAYSKCSVNVIIVFVILISITHITPLVEVPNWNLELLITIGFSFFLLKAWLKYKFSQYFSYTLLI